MEKRTKYMLLALIILGLASVITYGYSFARYASNRAWNYFLGTKGFYFSSEELGDTKVTNVNNNWSFESTYFSLKNSENDFLVSDYDIGYTAKCTIQNEASEYSKCTLNGTDSDTYNGIITSSSVCKNSVGEVDASSLNQKDCETKGNEWVVEKKHNDLYFDVVKTGNKDLNYVSVLIEVTSTTPYSKTLIGEFNLSSTDIQERVLKVNYKEFSNYSRVIVTNSYDENKCVKLSWDSNNLRIDGVNEETTSYKYDNSNNINEINFNINGKDSVSYIFYKTDFSKEYDYQDFILIESNDCKNIASS